jgi:hypothetical protein
MPYPWKRIKEFYIVHTEHVVSQITHTHTSTRAHLCWVCKIKSFNKRVHVLVCLCLISDKGNSVIAICQSDYHNKQA